jgi:hypothetical protein
VRSVRDAYRRDGFGAGMGRFIALTNMPGPIPADFADQSTPGAEAFGLPAGDDGSRDDALLSQNLIGCTHYEPDFDALRAAPTRVVVAIGAESEGQMAYRGGVGVAERLGIEPTVFPSHHGGFMGGEFGAKGDPEGFAAALRETLAD